MISVTVNCHECPNLKKINNGLTNHWYYICALENPSFPLNKIYLRKDAEKPKWCKERKKNTDDKGVV